MSDRASPDVKEPPGVDATDEDPLEPMGSVMRLVSEAVVHAVSTRSWSPRPIALRILEVQSEARAAALSAVEEAVKGLQPSVDRLQDGGACVSQSAVLAAIHALQEPTPNEQ